MATIQETLSHVRNLQHCWFIQYSQDTFHPYSLFKLDFFSCNGKIFIKKSKCSYIMWAVVTNL